MRNENEIVTFNSDTQISIHELQTIYNALTGKQESISKELSGSYCIHFDDLLNLHERIAACCRSYDAKIANNNVQVYHINGQKETFSSFDRFRAYNIGTTVPVENVHLEYNILIVPAGGDQPINYKITVDLPSRAGLSEKNFSQIGAPSGFGMFFARVPGRFKIQYVDYAAARHFQAQFDEWFASLEFSKDYSALNFLQSKSHWFKVIFPYLAMSLLLFQLSWLDFDFTGEINPSHARILFPVISFLFLFWLISYIVAKTAEHFVDGIQSLSYVRLNAGDKKVIKRREKKNSLGLIFSATSLIGALCLNTLSGYIVETFLK